ncbi:hypothetical protein [Agromyces sp. Root1464]|uniref:hypothetical protein n=1 Tax=Agromyces sp. Root1464 TaxID=1736467 RepID=UPI0012FCF97D|nr:hypothetical protein [Agromyces sp. Root1464]
MPPARTGCTASRGRRTPRTAVETLLARIAATEASPEPAPELQLAEFRIVERESAPVIAPHA